MDISNRTDAKVSWDFDRLILLITERKKREKELINSQSETLRKIAFTQKKRSTWQMYEKSFFFFFVNNHIFCDEIISSDSIKLNHAVIFVWKLLLFWIIFIKLNIRVGRLYNIVLFIVFKVSLTSILFTRLNKLEHLKNRLHLIAVSFFFLP